MFKFDGVDDGLKYYKTSDDQYQVIERGDGVFLLYKLEGDMYVYCGNKYFSLEDCLMAIQ